jgi:hypothetical protein
MLITYDSYLMSKAHLTLETVRSFMAACKIKVEKIYLMQRVV